MPSELPDHAATVAATEMLSPSIQALLDRRLSAEAILVALSNCFQTTLIEAGADKRGVLRDGKRLHKMFARSGYDRREAARAFEALGATVSQLSIQKIPADAIAWSLSAAIVRIVRHCPVVQDDDVSRLAYGLVERLNTMEAA